jgi:phospholipid/cholesterol/gamma-HCH transport system substrate-binding protein
MDHRVPKVGLTFSIVCAVLALLTFVYLNEAFEGPSPIGAVAGDPYELTASFDDTEALPSKQPVLVRGVQVGKVTDVSFVEEKAKAEVTFTVEDEFAPVHADASAMIGERTLLGDSYINLDPGSEASEPLSSGGEVEARPSVDFDEGLDFLDAKGREHVRSTIETLDEATRAEDAGAKLNGTVGNLARTVRNLRAVTRALHGQEDEIASLTRDGAVILDELGSREASLRSIVSSGRASLDALASGRASLEQGLGELPGLLDASRRVLAQARPLIADARPVVDGLRRGAPDLIEILTEVGPLAGDAVDAIGDLAGIPSLRKTLQVVNLIKPVAPKLAPSARNLVGALSYVSPRAGGIASFFANMASVTAHGDSTGRWARFSILFEPGELNDAPTPAVCEPEDDVPGNAGFCHNAYPPPNDALDPEPYEPGSYPRQQPFDPPGPNGGP